MASLTSAADMVGVSHNDCEDMSSKMNSLRGVGLSEEKKCVMAPSRVRLDSVIGEGERRRVIKADKTATVSFLDWAIICYLMLWPMVTGPF